MRGRTTFIIAHRLSTLKNCDVELQVEGGRLVEPRPAVAREAGSASPAERAAPSFEHRKQATFDTGGL
jgi:ABC-type bacteriocin/lantibiotic exporter with double-glycine peptidase domain